MAAATGEQAVALTVQEMARRSGFSEPTLRYYEKIGLLGPVARDESSGHRRYEPATVARVEALSCLRSAGMTVSGMRRYLGPARPRKSKVLAERAAWDYVHTHGDIELTVVNPTGIFGPQLGNRPSGSVGLVKGMLTGQMPVVPVMYFGVVDVRDVADLHLRAMLHPKAAGERFIAVSGSSISFFGMARILREHFPAAAGLLPSAELTIEQVREAAKTEPALRDAAALRGRIPVISNEKARSMLGWEPRDVNETIVATADSQIRLGLTLPENDSLQS
ncbi:MerR family transcriptional regulator [Streptomyces sp. NPDC059479]|uniref:MerR family transcriptional regulator n=1 Tax=Streptomyces sp. NPDC059479 TaxID=3346848 RepID=UPI0036A247A7